MQTSSVSTAYGGSQAERMLAALLQSQTKTGQDVQGANAPSDADRPSGPPPKRPPGPPPSGGAGGQFAANTLTDLLSTQEDEKTSPFDKLAAELIKQADSNGDGALSSDEIQSAMGGGATSSATDAKGLSAALTKLDTNGDGKLGANELSAALEAKRPSDGPGRARPSSADIATKLISETDSNGDGALGLDEIKAALGSDGAKASDTLTASMSKLDTDGDGKLSAAELSAALDAFQTANRRGREGSDGASSAQASITA